MKKQNGGALITVFGIVGILAAVGVALVATYVTNFNYGNRAENRIEAARTNNENVLAQYSLRVGEMAQVPEMYRDDLKEVFREAMQGRYGADGSQAVFQWLQEQNPQLDASVYTRLQQTIEAGRNEFRVAQTQLIDLCRGYETNLGYLWKGTWLRIAGYPKIDLGVQCRIVTSDYATEAFESGVDGGIKLRVN